MNTEWRTSVGSTTKNGAEGADAANVTSGGSSTYTMNGCACTVVLRGVKEDTAVVPRSEDSSKSVTSDGN